MKKISIIFTVAFLVSFIPAMALAQAGTNKTETMLSEGSSTTATTTTTSPEGFGFLINKMSLASTSAPSRASVLPDKDQVPIDVFEHRKIENFSLLNSFAFFVQSAVKNGLPTETVALLLLLPFIATLVAIVRNIIGLPSLDMFAVLAFSIALIASSIPLGLLLLGAITATSIIARISFKKIRIMQLPKISLSITVVCFGVLAVLYFSSILNFINVRDVSFVPILLLVLLSERIVRLQIENSWKSSFIIVLTTLAMGALSAAFLSSQYIRSAILLYPEMIFIIVPINLAVGRYFGLRITEYFRFSAISKNPYGS